MTEEELQNRIKKTKGLIVERTSTGYMVTSSGKGGGYLVTSDGSYKCACMDFALHRADTSWKCKHVLAVENALAKQSTTTSSRFAAIDV